MTTDPVCDTEVISAQAAGSFQRDGQTYVCPECAQRHYGDILNKIGNSKKPTPLEKSRS